MTGENLEEIALKQEKKAGVGEAMIDAVMGGISGYGTLLGTNIIAEGIIKSKPAVVYAGSVATLLCGGVAVYCGVQAVKKFVEAIKYNKNKVNKK